MLLALFQTPGLLPPLVSPDDQNTRNGVAVEVVDISDDDALVERYGVRIPVLAYVDSAGRTQELGWPFQPDQLMRFINNAVKSR